MQGEGTGCAEQLADFARQCDAAQRPAETGRGGGKPDLIPGRRPGGPKSAGPALGQVHLLAVHVNHADGATVIAEKIMVNEGEPVTLGGKSQIADPSGSLIQHFANWILDSGLPVYDMDHSQRFFARGPVRAFNIVQKIAGCVCADGNLGQSSAMQEMIGTYPEAPQHCQLSSGRNR